MGRIGSFLSNLSSAAPYVAFLLSAEPPMEFDYPPPLPQFARAILKDNPMKNWFLPEMKKWHSMKANWQSLKK